MTAISEPIWQARRTDETRSIEAAIKAGGFDRVDAYRYNIASIRVRVIDPRFEALSIDQRDALVEPILARLPEDTQTDITMLLTFTPTEVESHSTRPRSLLMNLEFEEPSPSML